MCITKVRWSTLEEIKFVRVQTIWVAKRWKTTYWNFFSIISKSLRLLAVLLCLKTVPLCFIVTKIHMKIKAKQGLTNTVYVRNMKYLLRASLKQVSTVFRLLPRDQRSGKDRVRKGKSEKRQSHRKVERWSAEPDLWGKKMLQSSLMNSKN